MALATSSLTTRKTCPARLDATRPRISAAARDVRWRGRRDRAVAQLRCPCVGQPRSHLGAEAPAGHRGLRPTAVRTCPPSHGELLLLLLNAGAIESGGFDG